MKKFRIAKIVQTNFIKNKYMGYGYDNQDAFNYPREIYDAIDKSIVCTTICEV